MTRHESNSYTLHYRDSSGVYRTEVTASATEALFRAEELEAAGLPNYDEPQCAPDCAERDTCSRAGIEFGHSQCGHCDEHNMPLHHCPYSCLADLWFVSGS
jgi:hypothetical protein